MKTATITSKTPFLVIVVGALLGLHFNSQSARHMESSADSRLVWTTRQGGKLEAFLHILSQNHARIVIWRSSGRDNGDFDGERKIFEKSFTDATAHPGSQPVAILQQPPENAPNRYRFEVFTSRPGTADWRDLSGPALMDQPLEEGRGTTLNFEDSPHSSGPGSDFRDIILLIRES